MFRTDTIRSAVSKAKPHFPEIQALYQRLPETRCGCSRPGVCCVYLPEMTFTEAMQWMDILLDMEPSRRIEKIKKIVEFYLVTPLRSVGCPFLENGACTIYQFRPFACRAYGLWSQERGARRTRQSIEDRKSLVKQWERFGIRFPKQWTGGEIDYCRQVTWTSPAVSDTDLMQLLDAIYRTDDPFFELKAEFENALHSDFSFLIATLVLGYQKAVLAKYAVIKEMVREKKEDRLKSYLKKISL